MTAAAETYIALLYSIGIHGNRRLIMADWRSMMKDLGFQNARTLIATGNAMFEYHGATSIRSRFNLRMCQFRRRMDTIVRAARAFRRLAASNPFRTESERDGSREGVPAVVTGW